MAGAGTRDRRTWSQFWQLAVLTIGVLGVVGGPAASRAAPGDLDTSFGTGGKVVMSFGPSEERPGGAVLQPDGKIVVGGTVYGSGQSHFLLARFDQAGAFDTSFGSVVTVVAGPYEVLSALLRQPDGKLVAVGTTYTTSSVLALVRYNADGSLDAAFGAGGKVVSPLGPGRGFPYAALLQPDGKIVVAGASSNPAGRFAVARFMPDGSADTGFGTAGEVLTDFSPLFGSGLSAALQADGKILVAGTVSGQLGVVRYQPDGSLDGGFGVGGIGFGGEPAFPRTLAVQPDGKIVIGGDGDDDIGGTSDFNFKLRRLNADGTPDVTFQGGGVVTTALGLSDDLALAMVLQPSGRIVLAGYTTTTLLATADFALVRYEVDGSLDATFGVGGIVTTSLTAFARDSVAVALLQPDGKIIAIGEHYLPVNGDFALVRYFGNNCGDGTLEAGEQCDDGNTVAGDCCTAVCQLDPVATPCTDDANLCTTDRCDGAGTCLHAGCQLCETCDMAVGCVLHPRPDCAPPGPHGRASLVLKDRSSDAGDAARWLWRSKTDPGDFGDPSTTDTYALCVYAGTAQTLWARKDAPGGDVCNGRPCWQPLGLPPLSAGAEYMDSARTPDGISTLVLSAAAPRPTRIRLRARGPHLQLPPLASLDLPVRVQIQRSGGDPCWEATFAAPRVNTSEMFKAVH